MIPAPPDPSSRFFGVTPTVIARTAATRFATLVILLVVVIGVFFFLLPGISLLGWLLISVVLLVGATALDGYLLLSKTWSLALSPTSLTIGLFRSQRTYPWAALREVRKVGGTRMTHGEVRYYDWELYLEEVSTGRTVHFRVPTDWGNAVNLHPSNPFRPSSEQMRDLGFVNP